MSSSCNNSGRELSESRGFTLLEVLISLFILSMIALGIYQATTETFRLREILSNEGDFYNGIRLSMDILGRDFSLTFNPMLIMPPPPKSTAPGLPGAPNPTPTDPVAARELQDVLSSDAGQLTKFWLPAADKTGMRPSRFTGDATSISFIGVSHIRIYKDSPESEFATIAYELTKDEGNHDDPDAKVLSKTESPNVFETEERRDKFRRTYPILHGVKTLKFTYYRQDKGLMDNSSAWVSSWDTSKEEFKDHPYPDAIKIKIEVAGPTNLHFEGEYIFRTEVPLNGLDPSS